MEVVERFRKVRAELKEELRDKVLFTDEQLGRKGDDDELEELFYDLPQTTYTDKHGFTIYLYVVALEGSLFKLYDNETGDIYNVGLDEVCADTMAQFLEMEPV